VQTGFFFASWKFVLAERNRQQVKQHCNARMNCKRAQTGGCYRSTEFVVGVPGAFWRKIFPPDKPLAGGERRGKKKQLRAAIH
jgi:hypothetical protein